MTFTAHLSEPSLAEDAVHAEGLVGDLRPLEPLPLEVAVEVLGTAELLERVPAEVLLHLLNFPQCRGRIVICMLFDFGASHVHGLHIKLVIYV